MSAAGATRPDSPRGVLDDVVHPDAGGELRRLVRWPHDRSVIADVRHGESMRPGELTDGRHQRIGGRPVDADVYQVFANGVVGDRQPLGETRIDLVITQRVGAVERKEGSDEIAIEGPDRRGGALNAVIAMRLLLPGDPIPPLRKVLIRDRARLEDQNVIAHASRPVTTASTAKRNQIDKDHSLRIQYRRPRPKILSTPVNPSTYVRAMYSPIGQQ